MSRKLSLMRPVAPNIIRDVREVIIDLLKALGEQMVDLLKEV